MLRLPNFCAVFISSLSTRKAMWLLLAVVLSSANLYAEARDLTITPKTAQRDQFQNITVKCSSSFVLHGCQFQVWLEEMDNKSFNLPIVSQESAREERTNKNRTLFDHSSAGTYLGGKLCALTMSSLTSGKYFVGCRVRNYSSGWKYAHMAIVVHSVPTTNRYEENDTTEFKEVPVEQEKNSSAITFLAPKKFNECEFFFPGQFVEKRKSQVYEDGWANSAGLKLNECLASFQVTESSSGILWCLFKASENSTLDYKGFDLVIIQVKDSPRSPKLTTSKSVYTVGQTLTATCTVEDSRPVARIVWMLGNEAVRNDAEDDNIDRAWSWPWDIKSITQVLTRKLAKEDNGKNLTCKVFHSMYRITNGEKSNVTTIRVKDFSSSSDLQISPVKANVVINGNFSIKCQSIRELVDCNFKMWVHGRFLKTESSIVDSDNFSFKIDLGTNTSHDKGSIVNVNYDGGALKSGWCGLQLSMIPQGRYFVGCRARGAQGGWSYDFMTFTSGTKQESDHQTSPTRLVQIVRPGDNLTTAFEMRRKIEKCIWSLPWQKNFIYEEPVRDTDCVANKQQVPKSGSQNGILWLVANVTGGGFYAFDPVILLVADSPKNLSVTSSTTSQTLTATCTVEDSRPVAKIVWMLGDEVVRNVSDDDDVNRAWSWPWDVKSITQDLTRKLVAEDNGKNLTCKVFYPNASMFWREESVLVEFVESNTGTLIIVVVLIFLLIIGAVIVFVWLRSKKPHATPIAAVTKRGTILEENDLYQSSSFVQEVHTSTDGARQSIFTDNPYEEVDVPVAAPPDTVQYEEIIVAPPASDAIPVACGVTYSRVVVR